MQYIRALLPKWILPSMKETSRHIFKMAIFSKFFGDLITHITWEYAGKKMKSFLNVSPLKIMDLLLSVFFGIQSLCNCVHKNLAPKLSQKVFIISRIAKTLWENTCIIHIFKCILSYIQKHMYSWTHLGNICSTNGNSTASWIHLISFSSTAIDHLNFFRLSSAPSFVGEMEI